MRPLSKALPLSTLKTNANKIDTKKKGMIMKRTIVVVTVFFVLLIFLGKTVNAGEFYREYWAEWDENITNCRGRLRVNDTELSLHKTFGKRSEAKANGLMLVSINEDLFHLKAAQLYLEMWASRNIRQAIRGQWKANLQGPRSRCSSRALHL